MDAKDTAGVLAGDAYYRDTAGGYDRAHARAEHHDALEHVIRLVRDLRLSSVLDTGCGTGLAMQTLASAVPGLRVHGNDPSQPLLDVAGRRDGFSATQLDRASSEALPYADNAFDAVLETGMLHHVPDPDRIVSEMLRVARRVVFVSDSNMYGQEGNSLVVRTLKLGLSRARLLRPVLRVLRGGQAWVSTPHDGIVWSYSVFDSLPLLLEACSKVWVIPTGKVTTRGHGVPLLFASHCLVVGLIEDGSVPATSDGRG